MNRIQKICLIALGYAIIGFIVSKLLGTTLIFEHAVWLEALVIAGIAFIFGMIENALGWGFFKKWLNQED